MMFSERYGYTPIRNIFQTESIDTALRNKLWNVCEHYCWKQSDYRNYPSALDPFLKSVWFYFFKKKLNTLPHAERALRIIEENIFDMSWYTLYNFLEFIINHYPWEYQRPEKFIASCNFHLEKEMSAYRIINGKVTPITNEQEIKEIEHAAKTKNTLTAQHINRAIELFSDKTAPDYRNSIKESISAVESLVRSTLGIKGTLGGLLKQLETKVELPKALKSAFSNLYGYTSDSSGIRHALTQEQKQADFHDAKFMLIACSAFINFVEGKMQTLGNNE